MWAILAAVVLIVVPLVVQWTGGKPAHSARRLVGYGIVALLAGIIAGLAMRLARLSFNWTLWTIVAGIAVLAAFSAVAGFTESELADFARAAGWRFDTVLERYHVSADFADLRDLVVDKAA